VVGADEGGIGVGEDGLEDDLSLAQALRSPSDGGSPFPLDGVASDGNSKHSYSVSLRSEPQVRTVLGGLLKALINPIVAV
jgi:hypothetical protein